MENQLFFRVWSRGEFGEVLSLQHYQSCVAQQTFLWPICLSGGIQSVFNGLIVFLQLLFFFRSGERKMRRESVFIERKCWTDRICMENWKRKKKKTIESEVDTYIIVKIWCMVIRSKNSSQYILFISILISKSTYARKSQRKTNEINRAGRTVK